MNKYTTLAALDAARREFLGAYHLRRAELRLERGDDLSPAECARLLGIDRSWGLRLFRERFGEVEMASADQVRLWIGERG